jgi:hypothetical protein
MNCNYSRAVIDWQWPTMLPICVVSLPRPMVPNLHAMQRCLGLFKVQLLCSRICRKGSEIFEDWPSQVSTVSETVHDRLYNLFCNHCSGEGSRDQDSPAPISTIDCTVLLQPPARPKTPCMGTSKTVGITTNHSHTTSYGCNLVIGSCGRLQCVMCTTSTGNITAMTKDAS